MIFLLNLCSCMRVLFTRLSFVISFCKYLGLISFFYSFSVFAQDSFPIVPASDSKSVVDADTSKSKQDEDTIAYDDPRDPFEGFNRAMWHFNYKILDPFLLRPVAVGYDALLPDPLKYGIDNALSNLDEPVSIWTNLFQGKFVGSANAAGRFVVNSTLGLGGLIDVAQDMGMERKQDRLSEVFGYYGVPNGPYFMLPGTGPKVTRELVVEGAEYGLRYFSPAYNSLYFPMNYASTWQILTKFALQNIYARVRLFDTESLVNNALDPYLFVKEAYLQHVEYNIYDGNVPVADNSNEDELIDEYLDEFE